MAMENEITETKPRSNGAQWWTAAILSALVAQNASNGNGGLLGGILGGNPPPPPPGMEPVSQRVLDLTTENQRLRSEKYTDRIAAAQGVVNATQSAQIACLEKQVDRLYGLTKLVVPNGNVSPRLGTRRRPGGRGLRGVRVGQRLSAGPAGRRRPAGRIEIERRMQWKDLRY